MRRNPREVSKALRFRAAVCASQRLADVFLEAAEALEQCAADAARLDHLERIGSPMDRATIDHMMAKGGRR